MLPCVRPAAFCGLSRTGLFLSRVPLGFAAAARASWRCLCASWCLRCLAVCALRVTVALLKAVCLKEVCLTEVRTCPAPSGWFTDASTHARTHRLVQEIVSKGRVRAEHVHGPLNYRNSITQVIGLFCHMIGLFCLSTTATASPRCATAARTPRLAPPHARLR